MLGMNLIGIISANLQTEVATEVVAEVVQEKHDNQQVAKNLYSCEWYSGIIHFLKNLKVPPELSLTQARALKLKSVKFCIIDKLLY